MAFDGKTLAPTYRFRADVPGSSYAFEIAERLGLSEAIIARSRSFMGTQASHLESLVQDLGEQIDYTRRLKKDLDVQSATLKRLRRQYEEDTKRLKNDGKTMRQKAVEEAQAIIKDANATVEAAVRTLREKQASKEAIREAKTMIQEEKESLDSEAKALLEVPQDSDKAPSKGELVSGSQVYWSRSKLAGVVLEGEDHQGRVLVAFEKLKAHVPKHELEMTRAVERPVDGRTFAVTAPVPKNVKTEIDVRGMRVEEALDAVDKFLDDAVLLGLQEVRIIHGVGTGALRKGLGSFLQEHPHVRMAKVGDAEQANPGVTLVTLGSA
jgi:DNA mismatch repair protein MutS2